MQMKKLFRFLKKIFPAGPLDKMRLLYYHNKRKTIHPLSEAEFRNLLTDKLHVKKDVDVFIHSSFQLLKFGFPVSSAIAIIQEIIGNEGTILFPTTHFTERAETYLRDPNSVFDVLRSPSMYGMLSEIARRQPEAIRSWHPTNSIVAIGKHAKEYVENHHADIYPCGKKSPYYKLVERKAIVIGLGVSTEFFSFVHCMEDTQEFRIPVKTRLEELFKGKVLIPAGDIITVDTLAASPNIKHRNIPEFIKKNIAKEIAVDMNINGVSYYTADATKLYYEMGKLAEKNITIYTNIEA